MGRIGEPWVSDKLRLLLGELTAMQAEGVRRIVIGELSGETITSLLTGENRICAYSTYYGPGKNRLGWFHQPRFQAALIQAREDYRGWLMQDSTEDAMVVLSRASVEAARDLERQVVGDSIAIAALSYAMDEAIAGADKSRVTILAEALGNAGLPSARPALERALSVEWGDDVVYRAIALSLGRIARGVDMERQKADSNILDRADVKTATKGAMAIDWRTQAIDAGLDPDQLVEQLADATIGAANGGADGGSGGAGSTEKTEPSE